MRILWSIFISGLIEEVVLSDTECPANLHRSQYLRQFGSSCYEFLFDHHGDWDHAQRDCKSRGGHLVTIGNSTEQAFIFNSLNVLHFHNDRGVWIGLTDHDNEGTWQWVTGEPVTYKHWASGQPGFFGSFEDCVLMEFKNGGHWHDYSCSGVLFNKQSHAWICEYAAVISPTATTPIVTRQSTEKSTILLSSPTSPPVINTMALNSTTSTTTNSDSTTTSVEQTTTTTAYTTITTEQSTTGFTWPTTV